MPKIFRAGDVEPVTLSPTKRIKLDDDADRLNIDQHFHSSQCLICGDFSPSGEQLRMASGRAQEHFPYNRRVRRVSR